MTEGFGKKTSIGSIGGIKFFAILIFLAYLAYSITFVSGTSSMTIRKDYWRHYDRILLPFQENLESWQILWVNHHHNPLLHIHQLVNEKLFSQNLIIDDWWMFTLQAGMALSLVFLFLRRVDFSQFLETKSGAKFVGLSTIALTIYLIIAIHMGGREIGFYSAPLESFQNYSHALALLLIAFISRVSKNISKSNMMIVFLLSLLLLFSHFSYGIIYIAAIVVTWIAIATKNRDAKIVRLAVIPLGAAVFYSALLFLVILDPQKSTGEGGMIGRAFALLPHVHDTIWTFGDVTSKALFGKFYASSTSFKSLIIIANLIIVIASLLIGLFGGRKYAVGTPLTIFGILFALATLTAREHSTILAPRISGNFEVMWAGCIVNIGIFLMQPKGSGNARKAISSFMAIWLVAAAILLSVYAYTQRKLVEATKSQIASTELALFMTSLPENTILDLVRPKNKDVLEHLQKNELNVFSNAGRSRAGIQRHMQGREICSAPTKDNLHLTDKTYTIDKITAVVPVPQCIVLEDTKGARALRIETLANKYDVGALHVREVGHPVTKFTVAKGNQVFYIPLISDSKIDLCVRKPLKTVTVTYCN